MGRIKVLHIMPSIAKNDNIAYITNDFIDIASSNEMFFDIAYFEPCPINCNEYFSDNKLSLYTFNRPTGLNRGKVIKQLVGIFATSNPDIIHLHVPFLYKLVRRAILKISKKLHKNIKLILHSHDITPTSKARGAYPRKEILIASTENAGVYSFGKKFKNVGHIVYSAINLDAFDKKTYSMKIDREFNLTNKQIYTNIADYTSESNQMFIIDIFACICEKEPKSRLMLVGSGDISAINKLRNHAREMGVEDKVFVTGRRDDIDNILSASNAFIYPSLREGDGLMLVEAQARGLLTFASDKCPVESKVSNLIGFASLKLPAVAWAEAILSTEYPAEVGLNLEKYDINNVYNDIIDIYKTICSDNIKYLKKNIGEK